MEYQNFKPLPADSLGIISGYRCNNRCRHCLYACHAKIQEPQPSAEKLAHIVREIKNNIPQVSLHIGGGEPLLNFAALLQLVGQLKQAQLYLEYIETNGRLISTPDSLPRLQALKKAGLNCVLLSISPFHAEFQSVERSRAAYQNITEVFGPNGVFPWHPRFYPLLEAISKTQRISWDAYCQRYTAAEIYQHLHNIIYLHPAGRMALLSAELFTGLPAEAFLEKNCRAECSSPMHAHVDIQGNYLAGFCAGLRIGEETGLDLEHLYNVGINLADYPILKFLIEDNLGGLLIFAKEQGFTALKGYSSACHLCLHIRTFLWDNNPQDYRELAPDYFYQEFRDAFTAGVS